MRRLGGKIASRMVGSPSERLVVLAGVGRVHQAAASAVHMEPGDLVLFVAPRAHRSARHIVTSALLVTRYEGVVEDVLMRQVQAPCDASLRALVEELAGWSIHADEPLDEPFCEALMSCVSSAWRHREGARAGGLYEVPDWLTPPRRLPSPPLGERASVVLFGYGHYARTCLMPSLTSHYDILRVHELDATLIGTPHPDDIPRWSTSPEPEPGDEQAALWCVAGYHHHHARLARAALHMGVDVLVEKPLITCEADLDMLLTAWRQSGARLWQGFHRRTWQVADWLRHDLRIQRGRSVVHYHCVVHEVQLPAHHWYRWRASGSRLIMNGCHWLDEFMHLNDYRAPVHLSAQRFQGGEVIMVQVELEHGATFSMTLSSTGSDRLGVRESTHISCGERSARLTDWRYVSEHGTGESRRARCDESTTYARMIDAVSAAQHDPDHPGEDIEKVERFWRMVCALDAMMA